MQKLRQANMPHTPNLKGLISKTCFHIGYPQNNVKFSNGHRLRSMPSGVERNVVPQMCASYLSIGSIQSLAIPLNTGLRPAAIDGQWMTALRVQRRPEGPEAQEPLDSNPDKYVLITLLEQIQNPPQPGGQVDRSTGGQVDRRIVNVFGDATL